MTDRAAGNRAQWFAGLAFASGFREHRR